VPKPIEPLKTFNTLSQNELAIKLKRAKLPDKTAENAKEIENARRKKINI